MYVLQLIRYKNLLITLATLALSYYAMIDYVTYTDLLEPNFLLLALAILLTAAGGYVINDYHDIHIDQTNKPTKVVIGKNISRRKAIALHIWLNLIALVCAFALGKSMFILVLVAAIILWVYSIYFKKQFLSGNVLVALVSALVILSLLWVNQPVSTYLVASYGGFAFLISLIREIIKDTEDMRGDAKFNCKTLPIVLGIRPTKKIIQTGLVMLLVAILAHVGLGNSLIPFRHNAMQFLYSAYLILGLGVPVIILFIFTVNADTKADFSRLSKIAKLVMVLGILSLCFIKF